MNEHDMGGAEIRFKVDQLDRNQAAMKSDQAAIRSEMKEGFGEVGKALSAITEKVTAQQRPNWQLAVAALSFLFVAGTGFVTIIKGPSDERIARLEIIAGTQTAILPQLMTKEDYRAERDRNWAIFQRQIDGNEAREEKHDGHIEHDIDELRSEYEGYRSRHER